MHRRGGATLIEVLIAIFVMAIGMIALLTLFPIGALRMAKAIQDDKCASAVVNASAIANVMNIRTDPSVISPKWAQGNDLFVQSPNSLPADPDGPSYPVYVDPIGMALSLTGSWVTGTQGYLARSYPSFTGGNSLLPAYPYFALLDDYIFYTDDDTGKNGTAFNFGPNRNFPIIQRNIDYTWAYLLQRPRASEPAIVNCSVVVYRKRPLSLLGNLRLAEYGFQATFNTTNNTITLSFTPTVPPTSPPDLRTGDWLLDVTPVFSLDPATGLRHCTAHGNFYRVVGVTEIAPNIYKYEVQQPIRDFPLPNPPGQRSPNPRPNDGYVLVLDGVVDVYDRGLGK